MSDSPFGFPGNFAAADAGVFWDVEDCKIPGVFTPTMAVDAIRFNLWTFGHRGTVSIRAYGDLKNHAFPSEGITLNQFGPGERFVRHTKIMEDIVAWAAEHPEPATVMLIIGPTTQDFHEMVHLLQTRKKYRFLFLC